MYNPFKVVSKYFAKRREERLRKEKERLQHIINSDPLTIQASYKSKENAEKNAMNPRNGEIELIRIEPEVNKCYEKNYSERSYWSGKSHYFSKNEYTYVGKCIDIEQSRVFGGDGEGPTYTFLHNNKKIIIRPSDKIPFFKEVDCKESNANSGGSRRILRKRRKNKNTRKHK